MLKDVICADGAFNGQIVLTQLSRAKDPVRGSDRGGWTMHAAGPYAR